MNTIFISPTAAKTLKAKVEKCAQVGTVQDLEMAELIWKLHLSYVKRADGTSIPVWQHWGYASLTDYAGITLHLPASRTDKLIDVWHLFGHELKGAWNPKKTPLGIDKMIDLLRVVDKGNATRWIEQATKLTCEELKQKIREHIGKKAPKKSKYRPFNAELDNDEMGRIDQALSQVWRSYRYRRRGALLMVIVDEWVNQTRADAKKTKKPPKKAP